MGLSWNRFNLFLLFSVFFCGVGTEDTEGWVCFFLLQLTLSICLGSFLATPACYLRCCPAVSAPKSRRNQSTNLPKGMALECSSLSHPQRHPPSLRRRPPRRPQHAQEAAVKQPKSRLDIMYRIRRWHLINIIVHVRQFFNNRSSVPAFDWSHGHGAWALWGRRGVGGVACHSRAWQTVSGINDKAFCIWQLCCKIDWFCWQTTNKTERERGREARERKREREGGARI